MKDMRRLNLGKQTLHPLPIPEIALEESHAPAFPGRLGLMQMVRADDIPPLAFEKPHQVRADKTFSACDQRRSIPCHPVLS
jgi:hypothetical protein